MNQFTPIKDVNQKLDIIDHIHQDHGDELLTIARHSSPHGEVIQASIKDIFQQGILLNTLYQNQQSNELFVAFELTGDLEDQILYLAYKAYVAKQSDPQTNRMRYLSVMDKTRVTPCITRLTIYSDTPLPEDYAGYAFALHLKVLQKAPSARSLSGQKSRLKNAFDRCFLWLMKHLSAGKRKQLITSMNKNLRLYTLRTVWGEYPGQGHSGYIDIFTHGNSPGSQWVQALKKGDIIHSRSEVKDQHPHLTNGKIVLIADETAYPAVAGILECWQNPVPPVIVWLSQHVSEQAYADTLDKPAGCRLIPVVCTPEQQGDEVIRILKNIADIDGVWGAMESDSARQIRHYLRNERKLTGKNNHLKAYWRLHTEK